MIYAYIEKEAIARLARRPLLSMVADVKVLFDLHLDFESDLEPRNSSICFECNSFVLLWTFGQASDAS